MRTMREMARLGPFEADVAAAFGRIAAARVPARIRAGDHTVWMPAPDEIANRLGWLDSPRRMQAEVVRFEALAASACADGLDRALLMGMGGSILAPEMFARAFGAAPGGLALRVLDSTVPGAVLAAARWADPARTLYLVSTKSGGTVETLSFCRTFFARAAEALGAAETGRRFVAITDPGSSLEALAERVGFREVVLADPTVGGRYSALTAFGLVPAALVGLDVARLMGRAEAASAACDLDLDADESPCVWLGALLGALAAAGCDKVSFAVSAAVATFGDWVEQLLAESTGKEGRGLVPVVGEPLGPPGVYGDDRLFVHLRMDGDDADDERLAALEVAGHPVVRLHLHDRYDLGGQIFLWELATAVAGHVLGINPFDQPDVESAKARTRELVRVFQAEGRLPEPPATLADDGLRVITADDGPEARAASAAEALRAFVGQGRPGDYVALQAYLEPTAATAGALARLRVALRDRTRLATTSGFGPRFLHSTGQLHKGDAGRGLFVQLTADAPEDVPIPDEEGAEPSGLTFGALVAAQALGDRQALLDAGRRVVRFHLGSDVAGGLDRLGAQS